MAGVTSRRLEAVLGRFNKAALLEAVEELDINLGGSPEVWFKKPKRELLSTIIAKCLDNNVLPSTLLRLELSHFQEHLQKGSSWHAYRLNFPDPTSLPPTVLMSHVFTKKLQRYLGDVFNNEVLEVQKQTCYWLCVRIEDQRMAPYTCYLVRRPPSPLLFVTRVKKRHLGPLLEAVCHALGSTGHTDMDLSGKELDSLIELAANQHSQGDKSRYRLNQVDCNPLLVASRHALSLKRLQAESSSPQEERLSPQAKRRKAADEAFGSNPLPKIEHFALKLSAELPDGSDTVTCKVKLAGSNVLEGTKAAIAADCFQLPVPPIISSMPNYASNFVNLETTE